MDINPETHNDLQMRLSIAVEFIQKQEFKLDTEINDCLRSVSLLYTYSKFSGRNSFYDTSEELFSKITNYIFDYNKTLLIVSQGKSTITWNVLAAICCFKSNRQDMGQKLMTAVKNSLTGQKTRLQKMYSPLSIIGFLWSKDEAMYTLLGNHIVKKTVSLDATEAWGLHLTGQNKAKIQSYANRVDQISPAAMNSLVSGIGQQIYAANNRLHTEILKIQRQFQILDGDKCGAFVHNSRNNTIRNDYVLTNALSFLQLIRTDSLSEIECVL